MSITLRIGSACILFIASVSYAHAQGRVRVPPPPPTAPSAPAPGGGALPAPSAPSNLRAIGRSNTEIDLTWVASTQVGGTIAAYRIKRCLGAACVIGTSATPSYSDSGLEPSKTYSYSVTATDASGQNSGPSNTLIVTTAPSSFACSLIPTRGGCMDFGGDKPGAINAFYQTSGPFSFFNQIKSVYNNASGSATVSADLATLNFSNGMQVATSTSRRSTAP